MKRITGIVMALVMAVTICACGAKEPESGAQPSEIKGTDTTVGSAGAEQNGDTQEVTGGTDDSGGTQEVTDGTAGSENSISTEQPGQEADSVESADGLGDGREDEDAAALAAIGNVETENGILTVSVTIPADLVGETTQEDLNAYIGELYQSAVLNEDGSVTYKMTKKQHRAMLESLAESVDESAQEMIDDDENYTIAAISHNDDCTEFNVTLDGTEIGLGDYFTSYVFFMNGLMYGKFSGYTPEHIIVNFFDPDGNLIEVMDSADQERAARTEEAGDDANTDENAY